MNTSGNASVKRIGLLWRGNRDTEHRSDRVETMLGPLFDEFAELGVSAEHVVYADDAVDEVRAQLLGLDGVVVWVNPIQDGANRAQLDALLREVSAQGVWVSAHPDVITRMGTKEVLFHTRSLGWGTHTDLYCTSRELLERFPITLGRAGQLVLKQARGTAGNGVWRVELADTSTKVPSADSVVRIQHAQTRDASFETTTLGAFLERCGEYFAWSGSLISQPYQMRLADGMIRCYFVHDTVVGFCHQWPTGLLDASASQPRSRGPMEDATAPEYAALRMRAESEWVPAMRNLLELDTNALPVIWDADFLYGPKLSSGEDTYVLCEINVSAVWPFPEQATKAIAEATVARITATKR